MKTALIGLLVVVALLCGGCSVIFLFGSLLDTRPMESLQYVGVPAVVGLGVAAAAIVLIRVLTRPPSVPPADQNPPRTPPKGHW